MTGNAERVLRFDPNRCGPRPLTVPLKNAYVVEIGSAILGWPIILTGEVNRELVCQPGSMYLELGTDLHVSPVIPVICKGYVFHVVDP